jgi:hypothetical protein
MVSNVVGIVLCASLLVLWIGMRWEDRLAAQRECPHRWRLESLYGEGKLWNRRCELCGKQEPVRNPEQLGPERSARRSHRRQ